MPTEPLLSSPHASLHRTPSGEAYILGFRGTWIALRAGQIRGLGEALSPFATGTACPCCAELGLLLRTADGDHRLPLDRESAQELLGLLNDALLLRDAEGQILAA